MFKVFLLPVLVCGLLQVAAAKVRFSNLTYDLNPEYVKGNIKVKVHNGAYSIGLSCDLLQRIDGNFWVTPVYSKKISDSYISLFDLKLDTCKTDPVFSDNALIRFISAETKKFISFDLMCPYEPGHYTVNDFTFEDSHALMSFIPKGSYHVSISCHHQSSGSTDLNKVMSLSFYADFE